MHKCFSFRFVWILVELRHLEGRASGGTVGVLNDINGIRQMQTPLRLHYAKHVAQLVIQHRQRSRCNNLFAH